MFSSTNTHHSSNDVVMTDDLDAQYRLQQSAGSNRQPRRVSRRSKYSGLDWEEHKEEMRRLYLENDKSLEEVMRIMKDKHSFAASQKLYKETLKSWGWQKNLPGQYAQWMTEKANKRKREEGKDTVFNFGGLQWNTSQAQKSALRSKKARTSSEAILVETPGEIDYETPSDHVVSPRDVLSSGSPQHRSFDREILSISSNSSSEDEDEAPEIPLSWEGHSRSDLVALFGSARSYASHGDYAMAEDMFLRALEGYGHILGPTHEDARKVAFALASFYAGQGRMTNANEIIEKLCRQHITKSGIHHRRTQQFIIQVVELLNGWNRPEDALAILARSKELAETELDGETVSAAKRRSSRRTEKPSRRRASARLSELSDVAHSIITDSDPARVDHGIGLARIHVTAKDRSVEGFLKTIINHCERNRSTLMIHNLRARSELLKFYNELEMNGQEVTAFVEGIEAVKNIFNTYKWEKKLFESLEIMEASLELVANVLKAGLGNSALELFQRIEHKAEDVFGWDEERTIWIKISIGILYQKHKNWNDARPWFEHAQAASHAANGEEDGISIALDEAMEKCYFTYLSDEGRPFRTVFGVSGITIRPNRLHLD